MGRIIDADELLRKLEEHFNKKEQDAKFTGDREIGVSWNDAIYYIKTAPEISAITRIQNHKLTEIVYCKECTFRNDYCQCTRLGLVHMIDKVVLPSGGLFYPNEPIAMCDAMHVNNDDGCTFGKRRTSSNGKSD